MSDDTLTPDQLADLRRFQRSPNLPQKSGRHTDAVARRGFVAEDGPGSKWYKITDKGLQYLADTANEHATVDRGPAGSLVIADDKLLEQICAPLMRKQPMGMRHLWLGDSGMGKTVANSLLIKWIRKKRLVNLTLTIDDKNAHEVQYEGGCLRVNPDHLRRQPPNRDENASHVVFRGIAVTREPGPDVDELIFDTSNLAWEMVRKASVQVLVNIDELADATNGTQGWRQPEVASLYRKGRAVGISVVATTQLPQELPRAAFALSETIGLFRMSGREAEYLASKKVIPDSEVEPISNLEVGQFRLFQKSKPLDPNVYMFEL